MFLSRWLKTNTRQTVFIVYYLGLRFANKVLGNIDIYLAPFVDDRAPEFSVRQMRRFKKNQISRTVLAGLGMRNP